MQVACCVVVVVVLGLVLGSRGLVLAPSPPSANSPPVQEIASSPPDIAKSQPGIAPTPVTLPTVPSAPSSSAEPPHVDEGASSPADPAWPADAPSPSTLAQGFGAPPPVPVLPAPVPVLPPPVALSPPPFGNEAPPPVATPQVPVPPSAPTLPATPALLPSVRAPAPAIDVEPKWPAAPPPSVNTQPSSPIGLAPRLPPPAFPPPRSNVRPEPPRSSFPVVPPPTSAPGELPVRPPITPPVIARRSPPALAPSNDGNNGNAMPPTSIPPPVGHKNNHIPLAPPPKDTSSQIPVHKSPTRGYPPAVSPVPHEANMPSIPRNAPSNSHARIPSVGEAPKPAPTASPFHGRTPQNGAKSAPMPPSNAPSPVQGPEVSRAPKQVGTGGKIHHAPAPKFQGPSGFPVQSPAPLVPSRAPSNGNRWPTISPVLPPPVSPPKEAKAPVTHPIWTLPPPPPNLDCDSLACPEPLTDPPSGAPCFCVLPIKVGIRLGVDLYSFFPLVSDFAQEVASGVNMAQRQVRVMGANVASDQPDKTIVLVDLVPLQVKFTNNTAFSTFESFWDKKISLKPSLFGGYEILYVVYPGLPPSPPSAPADVDGGAFGNNRNARAMKPLGVDVRRPKRGVNGSIIAIVVLSTLIALIICSVAAWLLILRLRNSDDNTERFPHSLLPKFSRSSGGRHSSPSGPSGSLSSSIATYTGQARTFKLAEIEKATNGFDDAKVLGEGGFGCVYQGALDDGTRVAVKVLKRYDCQGEREFLAEVEMLGRLHHRNLVKLLGICIEEDARCLVYELIPNGSVESHLHGGDSETAPLDWNARMKIALGAARGLAYLHEDSSPCVIHRDFKSSNILLEHDFTPKVSDFGLARTARGEGNQHISTRVMGTFGYVAPEYAMTGHLLVKSDVYSYGVVLLELLTGRKPVDMSRTPGQENLVSWARPLLTNVVSLRQAVDPLLGANVPFDNVAKVAAIASMCVQPEVAHRPCMSEVVQALKLVCSDGDEGHGSGSFSQELAARATSAVSNLTGLEAERVLLSDIFGPSPVFTPAADSGSFHKQSSSGPLMTGKSRKFWQRMRSVSRGSMSEHGASPDFEARSQGSDR